MIRYSVIILPYAEDDISNATDYIAFDKKSPATALNLARGLRKAISSLQTVPYRHEFDEDEELAALQVRRHYYKNYKIYYIVDEKEKTVYILRVLHMLVDGKVLLLRMLQG